MDDQDDQWNDKLDLYHSDDKGPENFSSGLDRSNKDPGDKEPRSEVPPQDSQGSNEDEDVDANHGNPDVNKTMS